MMKCKINPNHKVDLYGCIDCFFDACTEENLKYLDERENEEKRKTKMV